MDLLPAVTNFLIVSLLAGLAGALLMMLFMVSITRFGLLNGDMIRALGSFFTERLESSLRVGTLLHLAAGVFFALLYLLAFQYFEVEGAFTVPLGLLIGFGHGLVMSFILVAAIAEHHPLPRYQQGTVGVAFSHLLGHCVYGATVGLVVASSGFSLRQEEQELMASALRNNPEMLMAQCELAEEQRRTVALNPSLEFLEAKLTDEYLGQ